ncbi:hypothetical protein JOD31_001698 [Methylopila capsulata]|uniref:Uncharacterized protein n=1 Tax=Methylopila capsulata TaxID=61654 RepID=A0ABS2T5K0_9HYPH|nr:hypothetical protein [Methylopila capsulata]MBM7851473.1 hypothetical protein [Methylopila capsulata]
MSCGASVGRTTIIEHSAKAALHRVRQLQDEGQENIVVSHLEKGELTILELEAAAAEDATQAPV